MCFVFIMSIFHIWCIIETFILKLYQMLKICQTLLMTIYNITSNIKKKIQLLMFMIKCLNVFLTLYAISNISRKKIWEYKTIISHLMFSSCFFVCWKYWKVPLHLPLLVKWEVVSPNSRYREFYHEIGNIEKCPFTYWLNGGGGFSKS